jgi:hypothetical protein
MLCFVVGEFGSSRRERQHTRRGVAYQWVPLPFAPVEGDELVFPPNEADAMPSPEWLGYVGHISVIVRKRLYVAGRDALIVEVDERASGSHYWPADEFTDADVMEWEGAMANCGFTIDPRHDFYRVIDDVACGGVMGIGRGVASSEVAR